MFFSVYFAETTCFLATGAAEVPAAKRDISLCLTKQVYLVRSETEFPDQPNANTLHRFQSHIKHSETQKMTTPPAESVPSSNPSQPSVPPQPLPPTPTKGSTKPTQSSSRKPRQRKRADVQDKQQQQQSTAGATTITTTPPIVQRECRLSLVSLFD